MQSGIRIIQSRSTRVTNRIEIISKPKVTTGEMTVLPVIKKQDIIRGIADRNRVTQEGATGTKEVEVPDC